MKGRLVAILGFWYLTLFSHSSMAMSNKDTMTFGLNGYNAIDAISNVGMRDGQFQLVMRGQVQTAPNQPEPMLGIGVFRGHISDEDQMKMYSVRTALCSIATFPVLRPGDPLAFIPNVTCEDGREIRAAIADFSSLPQGIESRIVGHTEELIKRLYETGERVAKLDASTTIIPRNGRLLVIMRFVNSGQTEIAFKSPSTWEGYFDPTSKASYANVGGFRSQKEGESFSMKLGRDQVLNRAEYPDDIIRISPGQTRSVQFLAFPNERFKAGRYKLGGSAVIKEMLAPDLLKHSVQFTFQSTDAIFDNDYPQDQKELSAFEAYRRERLFGNTHTVGDGIDETGYYRAYGDDGGRDDFPALLKKGDRFPERTMEHQEQGSRKSIGPATIWRWEAYPDAKMTALTGEPCPRSGYWIPGMPGGLTAHGLNVYKLAAGKRPIEEGEVMPRLGFDNDTHLRWTWVGDVGEA